MFYKRHLNNKNDSVNKINSVRFEQDDYRFGVAISGYLWGHYTCTYLENLDVGLP